MIATTLFIIALVFLFYASYNIRSGIYLRTFYRKRTQEKIVALTFDDGPDEAQTPRVLDVLQAHQATASFFCIGRKVKGNEALLRRMVTEGHLIGNHSHSHANLFPLFSLRKMKQDLATCTQALEAATSQPIKYFRPPFGVTNPTIARAIRQAGYTPIGWNIRSLDTCTASPAKVVKRIERQLQPGSVILLHDRMPHCAEIVTLLLELLRKKGYTIVRLDSML